MNRIGNGGGGGGGLSNVEMEYIRRHHRHEPGENQCGSALVKHIRAPVPQVFLFSFPPFFFKYYLFFNYLLNICVLL